MEAVDGGRGRPLCFVYHPFLWMQLIDARLGEGGQIVANIPVRVSAKAVYSKYSIQPASPIDFGAIVKGTKKTQTVVLENKGMLNFKFCIYQAPKDAPALQRKRYEKPCTTLPV